MSYPDYFESSATESPAILFTSVKRLSSEQTQTLERHGLSRDFYGSQVCGIALDARGASEETVEKWLDEYLQGIRGILQRAPGSNELVAYNLLLRPFELHVVASPQQAKSLEKLATKLESMEKEFPEYKDSALFMSRWNILPVRENEQRPTNDIVEEYVNAERVVRAKQSFIRSRKTPLPSQPPLTKEERRTQRLSPAQIAQWDQMWAAIRDENEETIRKVRDPKRRKAEAAEVKTAHRVLERYDRVRPVAGEMSR
ncbi:MAG: hypothetical protein KGJ06_00265 [Pseudomonadota bacterium]|nr:hypothetical protein [Pseudomonadota bacterium]